MHGYPSKEKHSPWARVPFSAMLCLRLTRSATAPVEVIYLREKGRSATRSRPDTQDCLQLPNGRVQGASQSMRKSPRKRDVNTGQGLGNQATTSTKPDCLEPSSTGWGPRCGRWTCRPPHVVGSDALLSRVHFWSARHGPVARAILGSAPERSSYSRQTRG